MGQKIFPQKGITYECSKIFKERAGRKKEKKGRITEQYSLLMECRLSGSIHFKLSNLDS